MKRTLLVCLTVLAFVFQAVIPVANAQVENGGISIACIMQSATVYWQDVLNGVMDAADRYGATVSFFDIASSSNNIQSLSVHVALDIAKYVDADAVVIQYVPDDELFEEKIRAMRARGTYVVFIDSDGPQDLRDAYVGIDNYAAGQDMAELLIGMIEDGDRVLFPNTQHSNTNFLQRSQGIADRFARSTLELICLEIQSLGYMQYDSGVNAYLENHVVHGMIGICEPVGIAYGQMLGSTRHADQVNCFVCFDVTPDLLQMLDNGIVSALIYQQSYLMGYTAIQAIVDAFSGSPTAGGEVLIEHIVITRENMHAYFDANGALR